MIVYTRGRIPNSDQDYRATEDSEFTDIPIVVLANRNSASASEIVTRRAAGSRSRLRRRRDDVRQGARAVGLPHQRRRGPRADDGALLHAERPADSAAVGRDLRRVPELHAARSGREPAAQPERSEAHRRRAVRSTAAAASSPTSASPGRLEGLQPDARSAACSTRAQEFENYAQKFTAEGDTRVAQAVDRPRDRRRRTSSSTTRWWPTSASS